MSEHVLTKTLRDGKTQIEFRIEPQTPDPDTTLAYYLAIYWNGKKSGVFQARAHKVETPPAPGVTHAIGAPGPDGVKWVTIGLTSAEAAQIENAKKDWVQARKDRADAEREALAVRVREAAPGAPTWTISSPYGTPAAVGETVRDERDGRAVTGLKAWRKFYAGDGWSFGVMDESGYLYFSEVREATDAERQGLEQREARQARRTELEQRGTDLALAAGPDVEVPEQGQTGDLRALPGVRTSPRRQQDFATVDPYIHLRVDEPGGWLWALTYNGADGDNWSYSNYGTCIARRMPLTAERAALVADLRAEFGTVDE